MLRQLVCIPLVLIAAAASSQTPPKATATLKNAQGQEVGTATIANTIRGTSVTINATFSKLAARHPRDSRARGRQLHGARLHQRRRALQSGGKQHGYANPQGSHAGDLPNFEVDAKGNGTISFAAPDMTLNEGPNSLFHSGGTALVIHANADDNKTDPSGNAGARIACGVIEKAKS